MNLISHLIAGLIGFMIGNILSAIALTYWGL